ncbi:sigma-70 family RNA polymerase sigma factor [Streptomyces sp. NPDC052396]|uniref:BACON domain-containing protein n=1 Tax=Streptomyces sp. NPDC052396 TaxID=3365689 RepID=UPI0037D04471
MMTSRPERPPHATGAHRAHRRAPRAAQPPVVPPPAARQDHAPRPPVRYEPHLDGLFTYCLSVLCDHEAATDALGEVLALAERRADRAPAEELLRSWLYALARWECLRRLPYATAAGPAAAQDPRRHAELARLAWPEAAGTSPEQREALELAVRHGLTHQEVAAVLRLDHDAARALLASAACEVERTRTALAVVETGRCPVVARFVGIATDQGARTGPAVLLGTTLRRELVRHVDECPDCRRAAERTPVGESWPGTHAPAAVLPVLTAPRAAARAAMVCAQARRPARHRTVPRPAPHYDRTGFPLPPEDATAGRDRLRSRALTTTVVATVVAAPVLALWAAYRGTPLGEDAEAASVAAGHGGTGAPGRPRATAATPAGPAGRTGPYAPGRRPGGAPAPGNLPPAPWPGPGRLTVEAQPSAEGTLITLTASGGEEVHWSAVPNARWLRLSRSGGVLRPGESRTLTASVIPGREPAGAWNARVTIGPGGSVVTVEGRGKAPEPMPRHPATRR